MTNSEEFMERVGFLLETGERLSCLLNPESIEIRRRAGVQSRHSIGGVLTGRGLTDDPLLYTGGGFTDLKLDLLFDVTLAGSSITGSSIQSEDVRELTRPLWRLAENAVGEDGYGRLQVVRFVWGKSWNIPGVVSAIAERFEYFTPGGAPQRSWLRMRFLRVEESAVAHVRPTQQPPPPEERLLAQMEVLPEEVRMHEMKGGSSGEPDDDRGAGERLDEIAQRIYGDSRYWRLLAAFNNIDDPLHLPPGQLLRLPTLRGQGITSE
jgi:Contractile injection system tube protein